MDYVGVSTVARVGKNAWLFGNEGDEDGLCPLKFLSMVNTHDYNCQCSWGMQTYELGTVWPRR